MFSRPKVKVTVYINVKLDSTQYLEKHLSQSLHIHMINGLYEDIILIDFEFSRLKVKVTGFKLASAQYLENDLLQSLQI